MTLSVDPFWIKLYMSPNRLTFGNGAKVARSPTATIAVPVLEQFKQWLDTTAPKVLPSSKLGDALAYARKHWEGLTRYCEDGRLSIGRVDDWRGGLRLRG